MKRKEIDSILVNQTKRRRKILSYILLLVVISMLSVGFILIYINKSKSYTIKYSETSNIDYKVYLKDNKFFEEDYLGTENRYIASLIDYVNANFKYEMAMNEKNVDYRYSYHIDANVVVREATTAKPLYTKTKEIKRVTDTNSNGKSKATILENVDISYNEYNDLIKEFVSIYGLDNTYSTLTIDMYINVTGSCEKFEEDKNNEAKISLIIPLTTKTVGVDIKNNLVESDNNVIICKSSDHSAVFFLILAIVVILGGIYVTYLLVMYIIRTRSAESIYEIELKKILNYYHSYIQKVKNKIDLKKGIGLEQYKDCQFFRLETFTDLLEIRDNINAPILMASDEKNTATYFLIFDVNNKAIYVYGLRVKDIKRQIRKNNNIEVEDEEI